MVLLDDLQEIEKQLDAEGDTKAVRRAFWRIIGKMKRQPRAEVSESESVKATEIRNRLGYLLKVGLGYLTLNRKSKTLSGGESQRINLATSLGSSLVGSMYILDEPSVGLHPRDSENLIRVLQSLRDIGNTVIVVEHDEEMMRAADRIIDIGPEAGTLGEKWWPRAASASCSGQIPLRPGI